MISWKKAGSFIMLVTVLALSACNAPAPVVPTQAPTPDLGLVRTQAAQTVVAQITQEALLNPSATPTLAPTDTPTPAPTATQASTSTPIPTSTKAASGGGGTSGGGTSGGGSFYPTNTGTPYTDQARFVTQNLKDGVVMQPGQDFDAKWTVKNTGFRDWNTEFYIKYLSGGLEPKNKIYMLTSKVSKNSEVSLTADFIAPSEPGRYVSNWALINDDGVAFFHMYIVINVVK